MEWLMNGCGWNEESWWVMAAGPLTRVNSIPLIKINFISSLLFIQLSLPRRRQAAVIFINDS